MTVKDVWETEGMVTTSGAPALRHHLPTTDAVAVARLRSAGAIVFGKTNTPLYAGDLQTYNEVYGVTNNPWDTTRTAGGSSGGAAAALATGLTPLELGSDIGGSIRNPAHYNGVYGLKPSWGVVPSRGHIPGPPGAWWRPTSTATDRWPASLGDLRLALGVLAGPLPEEAVGWRLCLEEGPRRTGWRAPRGHRLRPGRRPPASGLGRAHPAGRLGRPPGTAGAGVEEVQLPVPLRDGLRSWQDLVVPIIGSALADDEFAEFVALEGPPGGDDPS